jgi:predicted nucleic acid-binding protein
MILVDTSAWLFTLKKDFHPVIKERIEQLLVESEIAICGMIALVIALELLGGTRSEKEYFRLKSRLDALHYIDTDKALWDLSSKLAFDLKRKEMSIPYSDIVIAASALKEKAILVHADSHFDSIADHTDLRVESFISLIR